MLQIYYIREHSKDVIERLAVKNFDAAAIIDKILVLDAKRRNIQKNLDDTLAESNKAAKEIGGLFKQGKIDEANVKKAKTADLRKTSKELGDNLDSVSSELNNLLVQLPNLPHSSVPKGNSDADNEMIYEEGTMPNLSDDALPHWELAKKYDIIDFDLGSKVTGAGFPFYKGKGAKLQRALINFFLDRAMDAGYTEYQPPLMVNEDSGYGTGQLPDKEGQMYHVTVDNLYLIPTAEVPLTNIYRNVILNNEKLPVMNVAYSQCFRRKQALMARTSED